MPEPANQQFFRPRSRFGASVLTAIAGALLAIVPAPAKADTVIISGDGFSIRTSGVGVSVGSPIYYAPAYPSGYPTRTIINGGTINGATLNRPIIIDSTINGSTLINPVIRRGNSGVVLNRTRVVRRPHRGLDNVRNLQRGRVEPLNQYRY
ncbi:MAG: hypothetical protein HC886_06055 [Leptolyngbyaceae cyanobacterium SM1_1_3]|nr:hypothetical protein [Leptolyngbyaceae cyanobacterium SM1_1_3]NJM85151.1 hypothetical protein [Leptolyngbyaceae cyanobacterium RM2_2_21]NJN04982.1 hypothetical protein [Leptolyngbyaceae cyanobacterium RM1_1_2]NJO08934.1 hypothetical protein [Leptolyngbyaceae cyanobacterium SL_1_1]